MCYRCSCCCCAHKANLKIRPQRMGFIMGLVAAVASVWAAGARGQQGEVCGKVCGRGGLRGGSSAAARAEQSRPRALQSSSSATSSCLLKALHLRRTHNTQHTTDDNNSNNNRRQQVNVITEQLPLSAPVPFPPFTCKRRLKSLWASLSLSQLQRDSVTWVLPGLTNEQGNRAAARGPRGWQGLGRARERQPL